MGQTGVMPEHRQQENDRLVVVADPEAGRFVLMLDDVPVGHARYRTDGGVMTIVHVETVPIHRRKDFAARLMDGVLATARADGLKVLPVCSYAAAYMRQRSSVHDLVAGA